NTFMGMGAHTSTLTSATDYYLEYVYYNENTFVADSALLIPGPKLRPQFTLGLAGGLTYNFQDNSTPTPTAWFWDFGDGNSSNQQNPQHTYAANGSYTVKLIVTTDCGVDSTITTFNNIGLDEEGTMPMVFYPNPTNDILSIATGGDLGEASIEIYSMIGTLLQRSTYAALSETVRLDLSSLPAGMYTVKVHTSTGTVSQNVSKL
ncbi:MAG: PKD domain-containing protein, partial [Schleiferiaceae bacterium]